MSGFDSVVFGGSGADVDAEAEDAADCTAPVAVETGIGSTQRDAACGRVGPGYYTQGARVQAAPSRLDDELLDEQKAQWGGPSVVLKGLGAEAGPAAEDLASLQRILEEDFGAALCDQYHTNAPSRERGCLFLASSVGQNVQQDLLIGQTEGTFHLGPSDES